MVVCTPRACARAAVFALSAMAWTAPSAVANDIPSPSQMLGIPIGADRTLADYRQIASYFKALRTPPPRA